MYIYLYQYCLYLIHPNIFLYHTCTSWKPCLQVTVAGIPRVISQEVELIPKATVTVVKRSWSMGHHFCLLQKDATSVALRLPKLQYFLGCVWFRVESSITGRKYRKVYYIYICVCMIYVLRMVIFHCHIWTTRGYHKRIYINWKVWARASSLGRTNPQHTKIKDKWMSQIITMSWHQICQICCLGIFRSLGILEDPVQFTS